MLAQEKKKAPPKMVFPAKTGDVTFNHDAHSKRVKDDCNVCHDKLWPQAKGDLKFKAGMHKPAEAKKTSCGFCHHPGGQSFESKGNCTRCHVKGAAKKG
ncbi:MAG TPA: c(7)-type cytochrome triheme domain-containing protein [Bryobacteraceae bacterium]|nr:c(7)-type cytochrome triheme domain-containing protein [Bryobacteraceae bacterium]